MFNSSATLGLCTLQVGASVPSAFAKNLQYKPLATPWECLLQEAHKWSCLGSPRPTLFHTCAPRASAKFPPAYAGALRPVGSPLEGFPSSSVSTTSISPDEVLVA